MRLTTWNVNGIRNPFSYPPWNVSRSFSSMFDLLESDIVVMQELKIQRKDLRDDMVLVDGWDCYFSLPKHKKGYSGVGIYTRNATCAPIKAEEGLLGVLPSPAGTPYRDLPDNEHIGGYPTELQVAELGVDPVALDAEGRCVVVEFPAFVLFGVYSPANSNGMRDDFRYAFICALDRRIRNLVSAGKNVVLVGDLNVTRHELDSGPTLEEIRKSQITREEYLCSINRRVFNQLLIGGEVIGQRDEGRESGVLWDTTREFHPTRSGMYTHWETKVNARPGNYGSRIDFVLVSAAMQTWIKDANIQEGLLGSDHCPVYADFKDQISIHDQDTSLLDVMSPAGFFKDGKRITEWKLGSTPAFSAKRMPEFDKRRSIKSMFAAPFLKTSQASQSETVESTSGEAENSAASSLPAQGQSPNKLGINTTDTASTLNVSAASKRKVSVSSKDPSVKRAKPDAKPGATSKGQQSLKGFFQAKSAPAVHQVQDLRKATFAEVPEIDNAAKSPLNTGSSAKVLSEPVTSEDPKPPETPTRTQTSFDQSPTHSPRQFASQLASAEQTQKSWGALFTRPIAPICEHAEPCKTMQTKKKGSNQGRSFWMCARPLGPTGEKERGSEWRCGTFIWCSDWQPRKDTSKTNSPIK